MVGVELLQLEATAGEQYRVHFSSCMQMQVFLLWHTTLPKENGKNGWFKPTQEVGFEDEALKEEEKSTSSLFTQSKHFTPEYWVLHLTEA